VKQTHFETLSPAEAGLTGSEQVSTFRNSYRQFVRSVVIQNDSVYCVQDLFNIFAKPITDSSEIDEQDN